jgi:hypothetical protein
MEDKASRGFQEGASPADVYIIIEGKIMNDSFSNSNKPESLEATITKLRDNLITSQDKNNDFNEKSYKELLAKYEESLGVIEVLKAKIVELERGKLPTKDEVESISAMLDLVSKLDTTTLNKIERLGKKS